MRFLLEDLHDDLLGKVQRFRYLHDLGEENGRRTMLFGGHVAYNAWIEARSSTETTSQPSFFARA
jgi:hypothetical protein